MRRYNEEDKRVIIRDMRDIYGYILKRRYRAQSYRVFNEITWCVRVDDGHADLKHYYLTGESDE